MAATTGWDDRARRLRSIAGIFDLLEVRSSVRSCVDPVMPIVSRLAAVIAAVAERCGDLVATGEGHIEVHQLIDEPL